MLNRDQILAKTTLRTEMVKIPEWDDEVCVRELTAGQRDEYEGSILQQNGQNIVLNRQRMRARLCAMTIVGPDGNLLFTEEDVDKLSELGAGALDRIYDVAQRLSGLSKSDEETLAKNSVSAPPA